MEKHEKIFKDFASATTKLTEALGQEKNAFIRDAALQRFEFTVELAWKALKAFLEWDEKVVCRSPRACVKEAYKLGWIEYEPKWLTALDVRNELSHTYNEAAAEAVFQQLPAMAELFTGLVNTLEKKLGQGN